MSEVRGLWISLLALVLALLALQFALRADHRQRNLEIFTEMAYSRAGESFAPSGVLPGGTVLQPLVGGVVPRGQTFFGFGAGPDEAQRAGRELANPFEPGDAAALERGRAVYAVFCTPCHDARGEGRGNAVLRGMLPPPSLHAARALDIADGEMFHVITMGQGKMSSYAAQVTAQDRWKAILHVRSLQKEAAR